MQAERKKWSFLYATQGGVVRVDEAVSHSQIGGICSDGMSHCVCLIVIGPGEPDHRKMSLLHTDLAFTDDALSPEREWVGTPCMVIVVKGSMYIDKDVAERNEVYSKRRKRLTKLVVSLLSILIALGQFRSSLMELNQSCMGCRMEFV
jgi:hypothetical protein